MRPRLGDVEGPWLYAWEKSSVAIERSRVDFMIDGVGERHSRARRGIYEKLQIAV